MTNTTNTPWPKLIYEAYGDTIATVHLWTQIIGKIRLKNMPWLNHSWHVTLYVSARGLTTGSIPYDEGVFQIDMDFIEHEVIISSSDGKKGTVKLYPRTVADFYRELFSKLGSMGIQVTIHDAPNEIDPAIPFQQDTVHRSYDAMQMHLIWQALVHTEIVFTRFRSGFLGKTSPVHLFWGSFDLAVTRFSGRKAPKYQGAVPNIPKEVMEEAYSHEVSSCGFWAGNEKSRLPVFYSYCYPTPPDFGQQPVAPAEAFYNKEMGEFMLPYEVVQQSEDPTETLLRFLRSTYTAAAKMGNWSSNLECDLTYLEK
ncbi:DUF5996 family protein [Flavitalea sp. BT771]|uniref:DUF5996 family protein n=1 Tax=Flavitalea sp. BT771 TaxID=3063329 RepID=UPI0026E1D3C5|nr:DUF5996 family protein [Flavitalea sp. BT771]MDO6429364.1 DUF5996 family protein [Flavitalea sp. BT771]MDV6218508.1 DUF5996 family protein [Flavitalea sp. BT771]